MIEVKDEILDGEPLYRIRDEAENIIYDNVTIEMTTRAIQEGTPINKALFDIAMPTGLICMWSGTNIPQGWFLCDGTNGTPDLRDRFIVGAGNEYNVGDIGGEKEHELTVEELASHNHAIRYPTGWSNLGGATILMDSEGNYITSGVDSRAKDFANDSSAIQKNGSGKGHENRPPYYALAYIMKA